MSTWRSGEGSQRACLTSITVVSGALLSYPCFPLSSSQTLSLSLSGYKFRNTFPFIRNNFSLKLVTRLTYIDLEMQSAKEKLSNMASAAKQHIDIYQAKLDEKVSISFSFLFMILFTSFGFLRIFFFIFFYYLKIINLLSFLIKHLRQRKRGQEQRKRK